MKKVIEYLKENWIRHGFETFVVINGILIAFGLNNWNENRKKEVLEIQYLNRLSVDLKSDTAYFNYRVKKAKKLIDDTRIFVEESYKEQKTEQDFRSLMSLIRWESEQMTVQNTTYIELTNGGFVNLFTNEVLKISLIEIYRHYEEVDVHIKEFNQVSADGLVDMKNYVTMAKYLLPTIFNKPHMFKEQEWSYINEPESFAFRHQEENIAVYAMKYSAFLNHFQELGQEAEELILIINDELATRDK